MTSEIIQFPSAAFPALPTISLALPKYWTSAIIPATLLAAERTVAEGEFRANVVVRSQRVGADVDSREAARIVDESTLTLPEFEEIGQGQSNTRRR